MILQSIKILQSPWSSCLGLSLPTSGGLSATFINQAEALHLYG